MLSLNNLIKNPLPNWLVGLLLASIFAHTTAINASESKQILYIESCRQGLNWTEGIKLGIESRLVIDDAQIAYHYMDAGNNRSEEQIQTAVQSALERIDELQPDAVIVCDDFAVKNVLVQHFKDKRLPFVFCGVNWDASKYGLPTSNSTGIIEATHITAVVDLLKTMSEVAN